MSESVWPLSWGALLLVYALPSLIAFYRRANSAWSIFTLNLLFGWTLLLWIGASVWALTDKTGAPRSA